MEKRLGFQRVMQWRNEMVGLAEGDADRDIFVSAEGDALGLADGLAEGDADGWFMGCHVAYRE